MNNYSRQYLKALSTDELYLLKSKLINKLTDINLNAARKDALIAIISRLLVELAFREGLPNTKPGP